MGTPEACVPALPAPKCSQPSCVKTASENRIANLIVGVDLMKNRRDSLVTKKIVASSLTLASFILTLAFALGSGSFAHPTAANAMAAADALSYLPASDAIALIDVRRLLNQTLPRILVQDPAKLAQANAEVEKFKARTGIDPRSFDRVVLGTRYTYPSPNVTKLETVAIAHGTFDAKALVAAGRIAANGKYREEKYQGATIVVISINDQMKLFGFWNMKVSELAVCGLDSNTLAIGDLGTVRAAIDAGKKGRASADLITLATRDPNSVIGFGANVPSALLANLNVGNDTVAKDAKSIRQIYGSLGSIENDLSLLLVARTETTDAAKNLGDTVEGLKQLGGILVTRMQQPRKALAQNALDNLKITTRGNEVEIRTRVDAASLASVIK